MPRRANPDPLAECVGRRVRQLRGERGMDRKVLLGAAGLRSFGHLSDLESGHVLPKLETLAALAAALDVVLADLFIGPDDLRERVFDASRHVPAEMLRRWLREAREHGSKQG